MSGLLWLLFWCPKEIQAIFFNKDNIQPDYKKVETEDDNCGFEMV